MRRIAEVLVTGSFIIGSASLARAACLDVRQPDPLFFTGTLNYQLFPGPPNYEDIKRGDKPERAHILKLDQPICATGDEFLDGKEMFDRVQLLPDDSSATGRAAAQSLQSLDGKRVVVSGKSGFGAQTGHHHAPLLMTLVSIKADTAGPGAARP
jgi:Domain of unknown function (DUF4431)